MRKSFFALAVLAVVASASLASMATVQGADHRDSPLNQASPSSDINDVYFFRSPANSNNAVGVFTVSPLIAPSDNARRGVFDPEVSYQVHIDRNGDLLDDVTVSIRMTSNPPQLILEGLGAAVVAPITPVGAPPIVPDAGGLKVFAGLRDDPFFFDLTAYQSFVANPRVPAAGLRIAADGAPRDTFAGVNTLAVVFEAPVTAITGGTSANAGTIKSWVSTARGGKRIDRMAIPTINTVLIPSAQKENFNGGDPVNDAKDYRATATTTIKGLRGAVDAIFGGEFSQDGGPLGKLSAEDVAGALIPDIVTVDFSKPVQFPNGRRLQDDVIDVALGVVLNRGGANGIADGVGANDKPFLSAFPYVADPHTAAAPAAGGVATGGAPSGSLPAITPPSTGDGDLLSANTMWALSAGLFLLALTFGGAGAFAAMRNRS